MTLEQQVVSLELAKKLKELGVEQESLFWWNLWHGQMDDSMYQIHFGKPVWRADGVLPEDTCAAFTVAELGELLPTEQRDRLGFFSGRAINGWFCEVKNYGVMPYDRLHVELQHPTEADARAKCLIYLIENKLYTPCPDNSSEAK